MSPRVPRRAGGPPYIPGPGGSLGRCEGMAAPYQANAVLVGRKNTMNYVLAAIRLFTEGASEVVIRARGKNVCKAVDAAERVKSTLRDVEIRDVRIYSEEVEGEDGKKRRVSAIEIVLARKQG